MNKWTRSFEWSRGTAEAAAGPRATILSHHYFAFLSYSHADSAVADWLHEALECFKVPSSLAGRLTAKGVIPSRLTPIFRDRHELAAGRELGSEIRESLAASRCLIVLCSPAAARSKWTDSEVDLFKRAHPDGCVIAAIIGGEPFASDIAGREDEECFPPALRARYDRRGRPCGKRAEPLAADLREGRDGRQLGLLKIVAGMLGVGLDDLIQRDHLRRQRRLAGISIASVVGMVAAGALAVTAIQARDAARDQRREAESLVGFMVGDLKDKLTPLGRLDVLDSVGTRALAFYQKQDPTQLSDESLAQRSRALSLLGQVASERGDFQSALRFYRAAFEGSAEAVRRSPQDPQRIYDHAQNVFYVGDIARAQGDIPQAEARMREYKELAQQLIAIDRSNPTWQMEGIYADSNLGILLLDQRRYGEAAGVFANALVERERLVGTYPENAQYRSALVEMLAWLSEAREHQGRLDESLALRERQLTLLRPLLASAERDPEYRRQALVAHRAAGRLNAALGKGAAGVEQLRTSLAIGEALVRGEPANSSWLSAKALASFDLARLELASGRLDSAAALARDACDATARLIAKDSTVVAWRFGHAGECLEVQTRVALGRSDLDEAKEHSEALIRLAARERGSAAADAGLAMANGYLLLGLAEQAGGNTNGARRAFQLAWSAWPRVPDRPPLLARKAAILSGLGDKRQAAMIGRRLGGINYREGIYLRDLRALG